MDEYGNRTNDSHFFRGGLYRKEYIEIEVTEKVGRKKVRKARKCLLYVMNCDDYSPPGYWYLGAIREGYLDFGLDTAALRLAVRENREDCDGAAA